jgi:hypothetical protein
MTTTTKVVAWVGAVFGTIAIAVLAVLIGAMMYAGNRNREQQKASTQLKQGLSRDLTTLSQTQVKPMTGDDVRKWLSGANSPTATPEK